MLKHYFQRNGHAQYHLFNMYRKQKETLPQVLGSALRGAARDYFQGPSKGRDVQINPGTQEQWKELGKEFAGLLLAEAERRSDGKGKPSSDWKERLGDKVRDPKGQHIDLDDGGHHILVFAVGLGAGLLLYRYFRENY
jgi:hypothetical protein